MKILSIIKNLLYNIPYFSKFFNNVEVIFLLDDKVTETFVNKKLWNLGTVPNKFPRQWLKNNGYNLIKLKSKIDEYQMMKLKRGDSDCMSAMQHAEAICEELGHLYLVENYDLFRYSKKGTIYHILNTIDYIFEKHNIDRLLNCFIAQNKSDEEDRLYKFYIINRGYEKASAEKILESDPSLTIYPICDQFIKI